MLLGDGESLEKNGNRMCLCSYMAAEYDDLPDEVKSEAQKFSEVHVAWLSKVLAASGVGAGESGARARAIYAAIVGAQLVARSRSDIALFDELVRTYRAAGLLPG
jgi:TetR/AcrR family transcriptional repressor of nem operon